MRQASANSVTCRKALLPSRAQVFTRRIVIKIFTTDADKLRAQLFSIDQGAQPISANTVSASGPNLKMTIVRLNGTYEGKVALTETQSTRHMDAGWGFRGKSISIPN